MPSPIETILTAAGLPAEDIAKVTTVPEAEQATFDTKPYLDKVQESYKTRLQNDPNFFNNLTVENLPPEVKKKIENTSFGRAAKIATDKLLKGLGMTEADYADLPDEQKEKIETLIPVIVERYTKNKSGAKEVQEQLIAERKEKEALLAKYGPDYEKGIETKYKTEAEQKYTSVIVNASVINGLSSIPGLKIAAADIAPTALNALQAKYGFERTSDFAVELRQKANPAMKVLKEGSSKELTLNEALVEIATERGWIDAKQESSKGGGVVTVTPNGKGSLDAVIPPHLKDKFKKKIAAEQ